MPDASSIELRSIMPPRIALGSIFTECNHLGGRPTDLAAFERQELRRGSEVLDVSAGTVGGMLSALADARASVAPLLVASTCPGGPLTAECYRLLKGDLLRRLQEASPVDGVLLALHGAAAADEAGDLEGDLLRAVREQVGLDTPVVATLDLHAHVTADMVVSADALLAWETYPHRDAFSTGQRGARMLLDILAERIRPTMALAKTPVLVSGVNGGTEGDGHFARLMRFAKAQEGAGTVRSTSVFLVHPYLDLPDMGGGGLVITDNDMQAAANLARELAWRYWQGRSELEPPVHTPVDAIALGRELPPGMVLLLETADCCGGGAAGDSVATLRALLDHAKDTPALAPVVDPAAAAACHRAGVGAHVALQLGHQLDPRWGKPLQVTGEVVRLSDGVFRYTGGIWDGQTAEMGLSAVLRLGAVQVLVTTHATYDWADEQYRKVGLEPAQARFVVVKNPMNYRQGYAGLFQAALVLDTPGPTPATLKHVTHARLKRPYFPRDHDIPNLQPALVLGRQSQ